MTKVCTLVLVHALLHVVSAVAQLALSNQLCTYHWLLEPVHLPHAGETPRAWQYTVLRSFGLVRVEGLPNAHLTATAVSDLLLHSGCHSCA